MRNKKIIFLESGDQKITIGAGQTNAPCLNQRLRLAQIFNPLQGCAKLCQPVQGPLGGEGGASHSRLPSLAGRGGINPNQETRLLSRGKKQNKSRPMQTKNEIIP
jgi:hypothetical protein